MVSGFKCSSRSNVCVSDWHIQEPDQWVRVHGHAVGPDGGLRVRTQPPDAQHVHGSCPGPAGHHIAMGRVSASDHYLRGQRRWVSCSMSHSPCAWFIYTLSDLPLIYYFVPKSKKNESSRRYHILKTHMQPPEQHHDKNTVNVYVRVVENHGPTKYWTKI